MQIKQAMVALGLTMTIGMTTAGAAQETDASSPGFSALKQDVKQLSNDVIDGTRHAGHVIAKEATSLGHSVVKGGKKAGRAVKRGAQSAGHYVEEGAHKAKEALTPTQTPPAPIESGSQQH